MQEIQNQIQIRYFEPEDENFILKSWIRGYRNNSVFAKQIPSEVYYPNQERVIRTLLEDAETLIACLDDSPELILGFFCFTNEPQCSIAHYLFVKAEFRRMGIASRLIQEAELNSKIYVTHWTSTLNHLKEKLGNTIYDPYRI